MLLEKIYISHKSPNEFLHEIGSLKILCNMCNAYKERQSKAPPFYLRFQGIFYIQTSWDIYEVCGMYILCKVTFIQRNFGSETDSPVRLRRVSHLNESSLWKQQSHFRFSTLPFSTWVIILYPIPHSSYHSFTMYAWLTRLLAVILTIRYIDRALIQSIHPEIIFYWLGRQEI